MKSAEWYDRLDAARRERERRIAQRSIAVALFIGAVAGGAVALVAFL